MQAKKNKNENKGNRSEKEKGSEPEKAINDGKIRRVCS